MKKVLSFILFAFFVGVLTSGILVYNRYRKNPEQIFPYPYGFAQPAPKFELEAPILIAGDRMGVYFANFHAELSQIISSDLSKPIKIQSMAKKGHALHRTLHELKSLSKWPQILIYQGASEEFNELKFRPEDAKVIKKNISLYKDDRVETALMLYPWLSRVIYEPHQRLLLEEEPKINDNLSEENFLERLDTEFLLYEQQLIQLINLSKSQKSLLILTTTPINLDIPPKKVCDFVSSIEVEKEVHELKKLLNNNDPKSAYGVSSKLTKQITSHAELFFMHGQICKRLGFIEEAKNALKQASAFDCAPWRSTEVYNSIIRRVAKEHQVVLFDFAKMLELEWQNNITFFDELYPQNLYYDHGMKQLGLVIKQILKL